MAAPMHTPRLDALLDQARAVCDARRGAKSDLARFLGFERVNAVTNWLGDAARIKPAAEYALGIQEWLALNAPVIGRARKGKQARIAPRKSARKKT